MIADQDEDGVIVLMIGPVDATAESQLVFADMPVGLSAHPFLQRLIHICFGDVAFRSLLWIAVMVVICLGVIHEPPR